MILIKLKPKKALNKAFLKAKPDRDSIEKFKKNLLALLHHLDMQEREEHLKNDVADFLKNTWLA
jgi:adenine-specific DNA-methyltransferase